MGKVDFGGVFKRVCLEHVPDVRVGQYVIVHVGFALSIIDEEVLAATKAATGEGPRMVDESDTERNKFYAEILSWQLGTLTVQGPKPAQIVGKGTFDADGRRITELEYQTYLEKL